MLYSSISITQLYIVYVYIVNEYLLYIVQSIINDFVYKYLEIYLGISTMDSSD